MELEDVSEPMEWEAKGWRRCLASKPQIVNHGTVFSPG